MSKVTISILIVTGICLCVVTPQLANYVMASMPKAGRLVGAGDGRGIAHAVVLAESRFYSSPLIHGSANERLYNYITYTDRDGNFRLPSTWELTKMGIPLTNSGTTWVVTGFKPGYAIVGDEEAWVFDERGGAASVPRSASFSPAATWLLFYVKLEPIVMAPQEFTLKEAAVYYNKLAAVGLTTRGSSDPTEVSVRKLGFDALAPGICAMPPESAIDRTFANALRFFAIDYAMSERQLKELEPYSYSHAASLPVTYRAGSICHALRVASSQ